MNKTTTTIFFLFSFLFSSIIVFPQCLTSLPPPDCNGTEPLIADGETIAGGTTKWYYGATATINSLILDGGTMVVCGNLTVDKFYMTTGKIFVRQGGRFVIGSGIGAGLQFKGDCAVYNYGTFELQRNLTMENPASATTPNIVVNALNSSVFKMPNQYFVITNAFSKFVNNGRAEFWGIITDNQSTAGCVCLGDGSTTKMAVLINKVNNTYTAPSGNACVNVYQYSEFYGQLTSNPTVLVCAGSGHTSNSGCIPFGCHPNFWGAAQVFTNCMGCAAIAVLPARFVSFNVASEIDGSNKLQWETGSNHPGVFEIMRSADEKNFYTVDSLSSPETGSPVFNYVDKNPLPGKNYYMIRFTNRQTGTILNSKIVKIVSEIMVGFNIYPVPFDNKFFINYQEGTHPVQVLLTDVTGRVIQTHHAVHTQDQTVEVDVLDKLQTGLYIIHLQTDKTVVAKTVFKR
jgi:hypothetical protein